MSGLRTSVADQERKIDLIEHLNDEHLGEILEIARMHGFPDAVAAQIEDIFDEGCLLAVDNGGRSASLWLPFVLEGDLEEKVLYLAYDAMVRQGKSFANGKKQYFEVVGFSWPSPHMLRLVLRTTVPVPQDSPGYAWLFALKTLRRTPARQPATNGRLSWWGKCFGRLLLWWMRQISVERREKVLQSFSKDLRFYTLRRARKSAPDMAEADLADVDILIHGDTPGGNWARGLKPGDIIHSVNEHREQIDHLAEGRTVLIADETALPALLAILEQWRNPLPPVVVSITADRADQAYFPDAALPAGARLYRLQSGEGLTDAIVEVLKRMPAIDAAWGAWEINGAKDVRKYLRDVRKLDGKKNRIKGYWKAS